MRRRSAATTEARDQRAIVADGVFFSAMVGLGESYVPAFVLAVGLGEVAAALVASAPMLAGAFLQLATPLMVRRLGSYRRWVVFCARMQALSFAPLVVGGALGRIPLAWVLAAAALYWGFGMATGPAWNAWVTALVRPEIRPAFFARRTQLAQAALLAALLAGGLSLELGRRWGQLPGVFAALFAAAALSRLISSGCLARQSEGPRPTEHGASVPVLEILAKLRARGALRVLVYLLAMQVAAHVAAPYFTPYMLGPLDLSYWQFVSLTAMALVARIAVLPTLGRVAGARGIRFLLWVGALAIVPLPPLWLVSHSFAYLIVLQAVAGVAWGAVELATMLAFFDGIDDADRTYVLAVYNLASAAAVATGAFLGSCLLLWAGPAQPAYAWLFVCSALARALALPVLVGTRAIAPRRRPVAVQLRTLAVRPAAGAIQRPILPSLAARAEQAADPAGSDAAARTPPSEER